MDHSDFEIEKSIFDISGGGSVERINGEWNYTGGEIKSFDSVLQLFCFKDDRKLSENKSGGVIGHEPVSDGLRPRVW